MIFWKWFVVFLLIKNKHAKKMNIFDFLNASVTYFYDILDSFGKLRKH